MRTSEQINREYVAKVVGFTESMAVTDKDCEALKMLYRKVVEVRKCQISGKVFC